MARTAANPDPAAEADPVAKGQEGDPATPEAADKKGPADKITAPGEETPGLKRIKVKATGAFLVHDPYTLDVVGEAGGEMRHTSFVQTKLDEGRLKKL